jgi:ferric-dicitrate binding protein FerR (iron transport regulator)
MDNQLLEKFIKGNCTVEELARVQQWLAENPEALDEYLRSIWEEPVSQPMPAAMEQALLNEAATFTGYQEKAVPKRPMIRRWLYGSAAAAIIIAIAGWWLFAPQPSKTPEQPGQQPVAITITAGKTERYVLPDQTVVWLKANTRLQVDTQLYNKPNRTVALLSGEAFFEVQKDPAHPFIVQNGSVQTKVLGTSFNVQAGTSGETVLVRVATGKVAVSHHEKLLDVLLPGKQLNVKSKTGEYTRSTVPVWMASLWKENELQLTNAHFTELQLAMKALYGVTLQTTSGEVKGKNYNIRLKRNTPVQEVVQVLALLNQIQYKRMNDTTWLLY